MKNSLKWTAAFLAACMLLSAGVMAEDVADETTEPTAEAEVAEATEETAVDESAEAPAYTPRMLPSTVRKKSPLQAPSATFSPTCLSTAFSTP